MGTRTDEAPPARPFRPAEASWSQRYAGSPPGVPVAGPRGPNLLVPRHCPNRRMFELSLPHGDRGKFLVSSGVRSSVRSASGCRPAVHRDQRRCPRRMCRTTKIHRNRAVDCEEDRFTSSKIVQYCGAILSDHCSNVGSTPDVTGMRTLRCPADRRGRPPRAMSSPPTHPWIDGRSGRTSQHVNQFGTNTKSRGPHATRDRRRASPRSSHERVPSGDRRKSKPK